jgi:hypothetical protein
VTEIPTTCPWCGTDHDMASDPTGDGAVPKPGDVTMCIVCGAWAVFDHKLRLRRPTLAEGRQIAEDKLQQKMTEAWGLATGKMKRH